MTTIADLRALLADDAKGDRAALAGIVDFLDEVTHGGPTPPPDEPPADPAPPSPPQA